MLWVSSLEIDTATRVQIPNEAARNSHSANTIVKGMNPTILSPAMGKLVGQTELVDLNMASGLGEGKLCIQT